MRKYIVPHLKVFFTLVVLLGPALCFGFFGKTVEMGLAIIVGGVAAVFLNMDRFVRFKFGNMEAELRQAVKEAYATIENMKEVAKPLIVTILSTMTFAHRQGGNSFSEKNKYKNELIKLASSINVFDDEVEAAVEAFDHQTTWDQYSVIIGKTFQHHDDMVERIGPAIRAQLNSLRNRESRIYPTEEEIRNIFSTLGVSINEDYENAIQDYAYFLEHKNTRPTIKE